MRAWGREADVCEVDVWTNYQVKGLTATSTQEERTAAYDKAAQAAEEMATSMRFESDESPEVFFKHSKPLYGDFWQFHENFTLSRLPYEGPV